MRGTSARPPCSNQQGQSVRLKEPEGAEGKERTKKAPSVWGVSFRVGVAMMRIECLASSCLGPGGGGGRLAVPFKLPLSLLLLPFLVHSAIPPRTFQPIHSHPHPRRSLRGGSPPPFPVIPLRVSLASPFASRHARTHTYPKP
jgi:hypothetical protein